MRFLAQTALRFVVVCAGTLLLVTSGLASAADGEIVLTLRKGGELTGRIGANDDTGFALRTAGGGEMRIAWKDLDERSWFSAKRTLVPATAAKDLFDLGVFATDNGWRVDAEQTFALALRADPALKSCIEELAPKLAALRHGEAETLIARAKEHVTAKRWLQALGRYRDARQLEPQNASAANGVGEAYYYMRRLADARVAMQDAVRVDPTYKDALLNLAYLDLLELDFVSCSDGLAKVIALPAAEGRCATDQELTAKAIENKAMTPAEVMEKFGDQPAISARQLAPIITEIVKGPQFATGFRAQTKHYDLATDVSQEYADLVASRMETIYAEYDRRFGYTKTGEVKTRGKDLRFPVIVFKDRKGYVEWFTRVLQNPQMAVMTGGVYVPLVKHLVFFQGKTLDDTLLVAWHEGFHQYLDYFVDGAPHWFNEGQAEYFGASTLDVAKKKMRTGGTNAWRIGTLANLVDRGALPEAEWLMKTDAATFMRVQPAGRYVNDATTVMDHYALGWAVVHFCLEGDRGRWQKPFLDYFKTLCDGTSHEDAFEKAWGRTDFTSFQNGFEAHCKMLVARARAELGK